MEFMLSSKLISPQSSRVVKPYHSIKASSEHSKRGSLLSCPYDSSCTPTALDFTGLISHAVFKHKITDAFKCPFCPFVASQPSFLIKHGIMKHGFYPRNDPTCVGISFSEIRHPNTPRDSQSCRRSYFKGSSEHFSASPPSTCAILSAIADGAPAGAFRSSLQCITDRRQNTTHSERSRSLCHRRDHLRSKRSHHRSLSKDSSNTPSPSPEPTSIPLPLHPHIEPPQIDYAAAAALYGSLPTLHVEPYPMPDFAEDTVIYPLEMPEFDVDYYRERNESEGRVGSGWW